MEIPVEITSGEKIGATGWIDDSFLRTGVYQAFLAPAIGGFAVIIGIVAFLFFKNPRLRDVNR